MQKTEFAHSEKRTVVDNNLEKYGNPRIFKTSEKLIIMLNRLSRDSGKVFWDKSRRTMFNDFNAQRKLCKEAGKSETIEDSFPHAETLEGNRRIP